MAGYIGTLAQKRLQIRVHEMATWTSSTPGACSLGRSLGCDDLDQLGWGNVQEIMDRDGALGFRMIPKQRVDELAHWMLLRGYQLEFQELFVAERETILETADKLFSRPLPDGLSWGLSPTVATSAYTKAIQTLMIESGLAPYSGSMLAGRHEPARTVVVLNTRAQTIVAAGFGQMPHNQHSKFRSYGFGEAVVVAPAYRRKGIGRAILARLAERLLRKYDGTMFYALSPTEHSPTRSTIETCGLRPSPSHVAAIAAAGRDKLIK